MKPGYSLINPSYDLACATPTRALWAHRQSVERIPAAAHAHEIGAAVNRPAVVVPYAFLGAVVADREIIDRSLADDHGRYVAQVFHEHQAIRRQLVGIELVEKGIELI